MQAESRLSVWARRGAILTAALASVATSAAPWHIAAKLPVGVVAGATGTRLVVESSHAAVLEAQRGSDGPRTQRRRQETTPWAGTGTYYLPPGFVPLSVSIDGFDCSSGGGMCSACQPPVGAFVRVAKVEQVAPWSLTATGQTQSALIDADHTYPRFLVDVDATGPADLEAQPTGGEGAWFEATVWHIGAGVGGPTVQRFSVAWSVRRDHPASPAPPDVSWIPRATLYGYCASPGEGECRAPADASVKVVTVTPQ